MDDDDDPKLIMSRHNGTFSRDGTTVEVNIYRLEHFQQIERRLAAIVAVAAHEDRDVGPVLADAADHAAQDFATSSPGRLPGRSSDSTGLPETPSRPGVRLRHPLP